MTQKISQSIPTLNSSIPNPISGMFSSPVGLLVFVALAFLLILNLKRSKRTGILARAAFGGNKEKKIARKLALKQIENSKKEEIALYIGTPSGSKIITSKGQKFLYLPEDPKILYLPNAQENILYIGRSGSGKTFSAGNPLVMSAIQQGFTVFYYDFKGHEDPAPSDKIIGYAQKNGYSISVLAPGYPESCTCNILDFLESEIDAENAYQLASVLNSNFQLSSGGGGSSEFFDRAANQLIQGILMLTKMCRDPQRSDIALSHYLLATPNLGGKLKEVEDYLNPYVKAAFDNYLSSVDSPETAASIATTASLMFSKFMTPFVLATFTGKSTLPLDVDGKHLIVFKMNPQRRDVVAPLLAATINMMVNRNVFRHRKTPLILSLDEVNTIRLPMLVHWLNQNRSSKFSALLGVQSIGFLEEVYGEKVVNGILGGCGTQLIFQLNDKQSAEYYSALLGNEEIQYKQSSHSRSKEGTNRSTTEQRQTRSLVEIHQLGQLARGTCFILNSGYGDSKKEIRIPIVQPIKIPERDLKALKDGGAAISSIKQKLREQSGAFVPTYYDLKLRKVTAEQLLNPPVSPEKRQYIFQKY
jgi:type IV secretory pathway TraG/TraD family ATPase VirD4